MKKWFFIALIAVFFSAPTATNAAGCDSPKPGFDQMYCIWQLLVQADKDMNDAYKELRSKLNPQQQQLLRTSQLAWLVKRDAASQGQLEGQVVWYPSVVTNMTNDRTAWLKARIRECNSTGCDSSKLK